MVIDCSPKHYVTFNLEIIERAFVFHMNKYINVLGWARVLYSPIPHCLCLSFSLEM